MRVTAADRARADRIIARVQEGDAAELAQELAAFREEILSCAMVRVEREFRVKARGVPSGGTPPEEKR